MPNETLQCVLEPRSGQSDFTLGLYFTEHNAPRIAIGERMIGDGQRPNQIQCLWPQPNFKLRNALSTGPHFSFVTQNWQSSKQWMLQTVTQ